MIGEGRCIDRRRRGGNLIFLCLAGINTERYCSRKDKSQSRKKFVPRATA